MGFPGANSITGNSAANTPRGYGGGDSIKGGTGDDRIFGGTGNDSLRGEGGTDRFYFDTRLNAATNVDHLVNFTPADDWIILDLDVFEGIGRLGVLHASAFRLGTSAQDPSDRILYDPATGKIRYDEDGVGGVAAILFATVPDGTPVTYADFFVIG
jgi:serralysin